MPSRPVVLVRELDKGEFCSVIGAVSLAPPYGLTEVLMPGIAPRRTRSHSCRGRKEQVTQRTNLKNELRGISEGAVAVCVVGASSLGRQVSV